MIRFKSKKKASGLFGEAERLWQQCIKARAGWKCEVTGRHGEGDNRERGIVGHHVHGKATYALRFSLDNGICLTQGRHFWTHAASGNMAITAKDALEIHGLDSAAKVDLLLHTKMRRQGKADLAGIVLYLRQELERFTREAYQR